MTNDERPIAVDLFGGVGGMALGFEQAGFDIACSVEIDAAHAAAHRYNFPRCEVVEKDVGDVSVSELSRAVNRGLDRLGRPHRRVDVVFGGPPCQGFSVGGIGDPDDPRNLLLRHYVRLVRGLRPRAFLIENVPAMGSRILPGSKEPVPIWLNEELSDMYRIAPGNVLNAKSFGVPQDRRRLIIWGVRRSAELPEWPEPTHSPRKKIPVDGDRALTNPPLGPSVREAIADLPNLDSFEELLASDSVRLPDAVRSAKDALASPYARVLSGVQVDPEDLSWPRRRSPAYLTSSLRTTHSEAVRERFASVAPGEIEPISRFYRLHPDGISATLRAGSTPDRGSYSAPRPIHPTHDRVISVREAARLHGFPDWFRFTAAKWHGFRQIGNSVCPPMARAVAEALVEALELARVRPRTRLSLGRPDLLTVSSGAGRRPAGRRVDLLALDRNGVSEVSDTLETAA